MSSGRKPGKLVVEGRPPVPWHKGAAVLFVLVQRHGADWPARVRALYVGDDARDIEAGQAAGTRTVAVRYGYIHPDDNPAHWGADHVVDSPDELRRLLDRALCGC